ncbi:holotricin-3 [Drosophila rhopaloa]|uniref:Uncharacterized protein n=1 Tax=Drosophila rhopaloa TaxID=1041015 RepID=A0ABM5J6P9_DRORH|nr:holotricin-3 [Drosophila rhopaloa]
MKFFALCAFLLLALVAVQATPDHNGGHGGSAGISQPQGHGSAGHGGPASHGGPVGHGPAGHGEDAHHGGHSDHGKGH